MENPKKWYINVVWPHLPSFVKGRVALVGDAVRRVALDGTLEYVG